jgi:hypothetical protein
MQKQERGCGHFGKKTKVGMRMKSKTPGEHMHGMKNKTSGHFGKKTKVGMGTKTKTPGERMHEIKTKPKETKVNDACCALYITALVADVLELDTDTSQMYL